MSKENKQVLFAMIVVVALIAGFAGLVNYKLNQVLKALSAIPTPAPLVINVEVAKPPMPDAGTEGSWIAPGGFGFMPLNMGSVPEGTYESITYYLGTVPDGKTNHVWVSVRADSESVGGSGATFRKIYAYNDEETYMATVVFKNDGTQMVFILDQDGKVFDSFEVPVSLYGTISELSSLTVASETIDAQGTIAVVAKVLCVTDTGHWYRHWPSDGSQSPALDNLIP
jgi:hypothetical protein